MRATTRLAGQAISGISFGQICSKGGITLQKPSYIYIRVVGTSGSARIKAGIGASNPVSGSHFPLPESKPEFGIGIGIGI